MLANLKSFLRKRATGNGCEVVLPWFPEANPDSDAMRLVRETRMEPEGSKCINYPVGFILWIFLSTFWSFKTCLGVGSELKGEIESCRIRHLVQMLYLAWFKNLSPIEYYENRFFLKERRSHAEFFLPSPRQGIITRKLHEWRNTDELDHKLQAYNNLKKAGVPTVEVLEVFYKNGKREFTDDVSELEEHIGKDFFVKPLNGYGAFGVAKWTFNKDNTYTDGSRSVSPDQLWQILADEADERMSDDSDREARMLQQLVVNHPDLKVLSRQSLNTLRVVSFYWPSGRHEILYAAAKMGMDDEIQDTINTTVSRVDLGTGRMNASTAGPGKKGNTHHPTTGHPIEGTVIPYWQQVMELVKKAHAVYPHLPIVGWDVAVSPDGPLIIEGNCNPRLMLIQLHDNIPVTKTSLTDLFFAWQEHRANQSHK